MGSRYVEVSRQAMMKALEAAGFRVDVRGPELVFRRIHHLNGCLEVKIYTSLPSRGGDARPCGEDAIRVCLVHTDPSSWRTRGLYKASKVLRTGTEAGVIERTLERAREAYAAGVLLVRGCPREQLDERAKAMAQEASR